MVSILRNFRSLLRLRKKDGLRDTSTISWRDIYDFIEKKEDRKYHTFLTDRDRLISEKLLRRSIILKSGLYNNCKIFY